MLSPCSVRSKFTEGCAEGEGAGGGMATSAGETSVELEDLPVIPFVNI